MDTWRNEEVEADHVPDWQPRLVLGIVEARSVNNVKKTTKQKLG